MSALDLWIEIWSSQYNCFKMGIYCFSNEHAALKSMRKILVGNTGWLRITWSGGEICLPVGCWFNELAQHASLVQLGHHHNIEMSRVHTMI